MRLNECLQGWLRGAQSVWAFEEKNLAIVMGAFESLAARFGK